MCIRDRIESIKSCDDYFRLLSDKRMDDVSSSGSGGNSGVSGGSMIGQYTLSGVGVGMLHNSGDAGHNNYNNSNNDVFGENLSGKRKSFLPKNISSKSKSPAPTTGSRMTKDEHFRKTASSGDFNPSKDSSSARFSSLPPSNDDPESASFISRIRKNIKKTDGK
eukprot:TRINITY_DN1953_c0_g1_i2.p1 TRINITY_DN1953_c0_g1~~TRINITY_DN1953_c0_g1_i2.p1  ORF type:complete len:164 (+),score=30.36 TRINITY_DN1953_c0_g1_i2:32-523(+)